MTTDRSVKNLVRSLPRVLAASVLLAVLLVVAPPGVASAMESTIESRASLESDTAEEYADSGFTVVTSSDLEFFNDGAQAQNIGIRFPNVVIPADATITSSSISFVADGSTSGNLNVTVRAERTASPAPYNASDYDVTNRAYTPLTTFWSPSAWQSGNSYETSQLNRIIQQVIDSEGETSALAFRFSGLGGLRRAFTHLDGESNAPRLSVTYTTDSPEGQLDVRISTGTDDVEERLSNGVVYRDSTDLELSFDRTRDQLVGLRFRNVGVPPGAMITEAWLEFEVDEATSGATSLSIRGERSIDASAFTATPGNVSARTATSATTLWNPSAWGTVSAKQQTPSLVGAVQEIVSLGGWQSGNAMAFLISGTGSRIAESYDGEPVNAPRLHIEFTTDAPPPPPGPSPFRINEIHLAGPPSDQWVEIINTSNAPADVLGLQICSSRCVNAASASSVVPAGGHYVVQSNNIGLRAPGITSLRSDGASIDRVEWRQAAATSLARCDDGLSPPRPGPLGTPISDDFRFSGSATKGDPNDCSPAPQTDYYTSPFAINEVKTQRERWVEIINIADEPANPAGIRICYPDLGDGDCITLEDDDTEYLEPGEVYIESVPFSFTPGFGVELAGWSNGWSNSTIATFEMGPFVDTSYGRCPNGTGPIEVQAVPSRNQPNPCSPEGQVDVRVAIGRDDAEEQLGSGSMYFTSSDLELTEDEGQQQLVGIRFQDVTIPADSTVTAAWIEFEVDEVSTGPASLSIRGERVANSFGFASANGNLSARTPTQAQQGWTPEGWTTVGDKKQTPSLSSVVQEIVSLGGWTSGNSMTFLISGTGRRTATSENGDRANGPRLRINYTPGSPPPVQPDLPPSGAWPGSGTTAALNQVGGNDWSGAAYEQAVGSTGSLWLVNNGSADVARIDRNGGWASSAQTWSIPGNLDTEGITVGPQGNGTVYLGVERDNSNGSVSNNMIVQFNTSTTSTRTWRLTELNNVGANRGIEAITFVPDIDLGPLSGYSPAAFGDHENGLFVIGQEAGPLLRFYALDHAAGSTDYTEVYQVDSGLNFVMGLEYDASTGVLYASCDNGCPSSERLTALWLNPQTGAFEVLRTYGAPPGHTDFNNEGLAILPDANCSNGSRAVLWSDDDGSPAVREVNLNAGC